MDCRPAVRGAVRRNYSPGLTTYSALSPLKVRAHVSVCALASRGSTTRAPCWLLFLRIFFPCLRILTPLRVAPARRLSTTDSRPRSSIKTDGRYSSNGRSYSAFDYSFVDEGNSGFRLTAAAAAH